MNKLVPTGGVLSFSDKCGIAFFTASLSPLEIQQLMSENIGIAAIAPDEKVEMVEIGTDTSSKMKKREDENVQSARVRLSKIRKREDPLRNKGTNTTVSPETSGIHFNIPVV